MTDSQMLTHICTICGAFTLFGLALRIIEFLVHSFLSIQNAVFEYSSILYVFTCLFVVGIWVFFLWFFDQIVNEDVRYFKALNRQANDEVKKLKFEICEYKRMKENNSTMTTSSKN